MNTLDALVGKLAKRPEFVQVAVLVALAILGADLLTLIFYSIFFYDRLLLDLLLTTVIVVVVAFPLSTIFVRQHARIAKLVAELELSAASDGLTGLLNRKAFFERTRVLIASADERRDVGAMLFVDADHFKNINDRFGHAAGDQVLREIAVAIRSAISGRGLAARMGGEEFAVFLPGANGNDALRTSDAIRTAIANIPSAATVRVTASVGVSAHLKGDDLETTLRLADRNLYRAKDGGRNRVVFLGAADVA